MKGPSETGMNNIVEIGEKLGKRIVVSGCVPQADKKNKFLLNFSAIGKDYLLSAYLK